MSVNHRMKQVRKYLNLTQKEFGEKLDATQSYITNLERGVNNVTEKILKLVSLQHNINEHWLRTGEGDMFDNAKSATIDRIAERYNLDNVDKAMLISFASLPPESRAAIKDFMFSTVEKLKSDNFNKAENIPSVALLPPISKHSTMPKHISHALTSIKLSEQAVSAGDGAYLGPEQFITVQVPSNIAGINTDFAVPVVGDSMTPLYSNGDILLVSYKETVSIGEIGIFSIEGVSYVKKLGTDCLVSLNPQYNDIMLKGVTCNGKVIGKISSRDIIY